MKVINHSKYSSIQLRSVICAAHRSLSRTQGKMPRWNYTEIEIKRRRTDLTHRTSGHATVGGRHAVLILPAPRCTVAALYALAWHEIQHLYGYHHANMGIYYPLESEIKEMTSGMPEYLEEIAPPPKPKQNLQLLRYQTTLDRVKAWETKLKRAQHALKKLKERQRYYETTLTAAGKLPQKKKS